MEEMAHLWQSLIKWAKVRVFALNWACSYKIYKISTC